MTFDASTARRAPGTVIAAAIVLGLFGGLAGLALAGIGVVGLLSEGGFYGDAALPLGVLGMLILAATVFGVIGLTRGNRGAQVLAIGLGGIGFLANLITLRGNPVVGIVGLVVSAALVLLVAVPVSSRDWFSR